MKQKNTRKGNALQHLLLYKEGTVWKFDDRLLQIEAEPFVSGMSEIISHYTGEACQNCELLFALERFPEAGVLQLEGEECSGGWYHDIRTGMRGWLCPVTRLYCQGNIPPAIYYTIKSLPS